MQGIERIELLSLALEYFNAYFPSLFLYLDQLRGKPSGCRLETSRGQSTPTEVARPKWITELAGSLPEHLLTGISGTLNKASAQVDSMPFTPLAPFAPFAGLPPQN